MKSAVDGIAGAILGAATNVVLIWKELLVYTESTKRPLVGGGVFGLLVGMILGSTIAVRASVVTIVSIVGVLAIAGFNRIVQGEVNFWGRGMVLYLLPLLIAASLSFLGAKISEVVRKSVARARRKGHQ